MRSRPAVIATLLALVAAPASVRAQYIDVNQPLHANMPYTDAVPYGFYGPGPLAQQSFIAQAPNIMGGGFWWHGQVSNVFPSASEVRISLFTSVTGGLLAQSIVSFDFGTTRNGWVDGFWNPVLVTPGQQYFLAIQAINTAPLSGPGFWGNVYKGGTAYLGGNFMDLTGNVPPDGYYDFTFRTWTTVPEPSTYAMMAAGLLALGVIARRRRAA